MRVKERLSGGSGRLGGVSEGSVWLEKGLGHLLG